MATDAERVVVIFNLFDLKMRLQNHIGQEVSWAEISRQSGVNQTTLTKLLHNRARRIDLDTAERLINYFRSQGLLGITHADLFLTISKEKSDEGT